ncbi:MAG: hypothetical protein QNJ35_10290 [Paracoccaceae bacterium]|nr:hypothetical protein [Paracoccaceae bacterium]
MVLSTISHLFPWIALFGPIVLVVLILGAMRLLDVMRSKHDVVIHERNIG